MIIGVTSELPTYYVMRLTGYMTPKKEKENKNERKLRFNYEAYNWANFLQIWGKRANRVQVKVFWELFVRILRTP